MPAPVTSSSARTASKPTTQKPSTIPTKKTRIVRRRGRAKGGIESDDEIERELGTDSESDDDISSLDSATDDSDTEPASEDVVAEGLIRPHSTTSHSPKSMVKPSLSDKVAPFFAPTGNWSEMVADENANGPADLPVIEFSEFDGQASPAVGIPSRKTKKPKKASSTSTSAALLQRSVKEDEVTEEHVEAPSTSNHSSDHSKRVPGQTARQAYQERLENDPSYVPKVGGFWNHDDRLIEKDLRSLSGWWRGRWQGRGRGRGFGTRGRGGLHIPMVNPSEDLVESTPTNKEELAPIEKAWTHDGFEEMKRKEDQRRPAQHNSQNGPRPFQSTNGFRGGRGNFARGGRGGFGRGNFLTSPRSRVNSSLLPHGRVWFAMKPELMWTKQHEGFLYFDSSLKPRPGQGPGFRVKLSGSETQVIRMPPRPYPSQKPSSPIPATASVLGSDLGEKSFIVHLPKRSGKEKAVESVVTAEELPIEDVFTVRPQFVTAEPIALPEPSGSSANNTRVSELPAIAANSDSTATEPGPSIRSQLEQLSLEPKSPNPARWAQTEQAVLRNPSVDSVELHQPHPSTDRQRNSLPHVQTVFSPPPPISQTSPAFGSPYAYGAPLPPGIAINQHGMPYELATGRPVYLQAPQMFNPRPLIHSHMGPPGIPFVPSHMHHPSAISPDFLAQPSSHTPPINGFIDPSTGTPIFSFPRQTSRIEIRAPSESSGKPSSQPPTRTVSGLRSIATSFEPSRPSNEPELNYYPSLSNPVDANSPPSYDGSAPGDESHVSQHAGPAMMPYPPYQQQYYYPEAYGYPQYVDMSQVGQYEMYPAMDHQPQGTVYY